MAYNDLTNMLMANPWMFDPSQQSNQFSNYNNAALPWPPTYNLGNAGGPVNAATGQVIPSFLQWQQANPAGMSINSTPAQPAQTPTQPQQQPFRTAASPFQYNTTNGGFTVIQPQPTRYTPQQQQPQAAAPQAQTGGAPNNWQAAINSLAMPGKVQTMGATVPMATGSQPAGGVNQAFLNQAGAGQGMNQNFLNALRAIQGR